MMLFVIFIIINVIGLFVDCYLLLFLLFIIVIEKETSSKELSMSIQLGGVTTITNNTTINNTNIFNTIFQHDHTINYSLTTTLSLRSKMHQNYIWYRFFLKRIKECGIIPISITQILY